ncbi:DNA helicase MCM8-like [Euwallacea fornicatus]|uniref:DNA helicase MCM8-like n=1 Tax=Euwallacea fornicatus TaxID=995702 RepID=UPI00338E7478
MQNDPPQRLCGIDNYFFRPKNADLQKIHSNVASFQRYLARHPEKCPLAQVEKDRFMSLSYKALILDQEFLTNWSNFKEDLVTNAEFTLNCLGLSVYEHICSCHKQKSEESQTKKVPVIRVRIFDFEPQILLKYVSPTNLGKLVSLRGTVVKSSPDKVICTYLGFHCHSCNSVQVAKQSNGNFTPMTVCPSCSTKGRFEVAYNSSLTKTIEWQSVVLQEIECDTAKIPQTLECELTEDLVKSCPPGDDVTVTGIVRVIDPNDNKGKNKQNALFQLYLQVVAVFNNKSETSGRKDDFFTPEDYEAIKLVHSQPDLFGYLTHSLCPTIYGNELVKAGLLLGLFRGAKSSSRSESHILMVGDPGLGKSQMLKSCANVSPRGVYVCGNSSTNSGLTVTMTRESGGEYSFEAGALMVADRGCCCIDEFDKMPTQHACLLEAMEQQSISIAKAGMVCSLPTRPTILVAANPVGGHYNKDKTVAENLKMGSPMLSRFDLIFILLDQPNEHLDKRLSRHILTVHSSKRRRLAANTSKDPEEEPQVIQSLRERLSHEKNRDCLPHKTLRKYLAYAQKYVNPILSPEAKSAAKNFYVSLRRQFATEDCTPVTARQLLSLIRLIQARAKTELREEASEQDAKDVIEIMRHSLLEVFTDETGMLDTTRSQLGSGMSYKNQVGKLLDVLQRRSEVEVKSVFTLQEIRQAAETIGILKSKFNNALQSLNIQGFLLSKGGNTYQLNSAYL